MSNVQKKINWIRIIRPIAFALVLVFLLSYATYAWMKRDWKPKIHQENVRIVAGSSLTFIFQEDNIDDIPINDLLGMNEFTFKSVSNATGKSEHFFNLNYGTQGEIYDTFNHLGFEDIVSDFDKYDNRYTALGRSCGYIELTFKIASAAEGEVYDKNIYLVNSYIDGVEVAGNADATNLNKKAAEAIRLSITLHETATEAESTIIFAKTATTHKGINNAEIGGIYMADGVERYDRTKNPPELQTQIQNVHLAEPISLTKTTTIKTFSSFSTDPLFVLEKGTQRTITVRIWLEGEDPNCTNDIADSALNLLLQFSAEDIDNS